MSKIISFSGRLQSGKTELSNICEKYGYEKIYFALPLKQLCADILDISIDALNEAKKEGTDIGLSIGDDICTTLSEETGIPLENVKDVCYGKVLNNVREMLQFIGTDLIRKYNTNWHVNRIREMIDPSKNYVIDDVRFPNELKLVSELGGDSWFVIRPKIDNISNHESETALNWRDFGNKIIINDASLELFLFRWEVFFNNYEKSLEVRNKCIGNENIVNLYGELSEPLCVTELLEISPYIFSYEEREFKKDLIENVKQDKDNNVFIQYKDGTNEVVQNPINVEDLKFCL